MINVEIIRTERALEDIKDSWTDLLEVMSSPSIFLTWEWVTTWWRHYGQDYELYVLAARDHDNALVGIAPLMMIKSGWGPLALKRLAFIGTGIMYPAHLDFIIPSDQKKSVARAFLSFLNEHLREWDLLELMSIAERSPLKSSLMEANGHVGEGYAMPCPYILLPNDWETYQEQNLSASKRKDIAYHQRRINRDFPDQVNFEEVANIEQLTEALAFLKEMHLQRWGSEGMATPFESDQYMALHKDFAAAAMEKDWLRFSVLRVRDELLAVNYCFRYRDVYYGYQRAYNPEWSKYSPGRLLMVHVIRSAISDGARELDMLHGEKGDKYDWGESVRFDGRTRFSQGLKGSGLLLATTVFDKAVTASRKYLPESVRQRAGRLVPRMQW